MNFFKIPEKRKNVPDLDCVSKTRNYINKRSKIDLFLPFWVMEMLQPVQFFMLINKKNSWSVLQWIHVFWHILIYYMKDMLGIVSSDYILLVNNPTMLSWSSQRGSLAIVFIRDLGNPFIGENQMYFCFDGIFTY